MKSSLEEVIPIALSYRIIKNTEPLEEKKLTSLDLSQYMEKSEALKQDEIRKIIKREDPMDVVKREIRKNLEEEIEIKKTAMLEKPVKIFRRNGKEFWKKQDQKGSRKV